MNILENKERISSKKSPETGEQFDEKGYSQKIEEISKEKEENKNKQKEEINNLNNALDAFDEGTIINEKGDNFGKEALPIEKKETWRGKLKGIFQKQSKGQSKDKIESTQKNKDLSLFPEYKKYEKIFKKIVNKLVNGYSKIKGEKYYKAMQRGFNNSISCFKGDMVITYFNKLLKDKDYELVVIEPENFKMRVKGAAEYCKLVNKKTGEEKKVTIGPYDRPIVFE